MLRREVDEVKEHFMEWQSISLQWYQWVDFWTDDNVFFFFFFFVLWFPDSGLSEHRELPVERRRRAPAVDVLGHVTAPVVVVCVFPPRQHQQRLPRRTFVVVVSPRSPSLRFQRLFEQDGQAVAGWRGDVVGWRRTGPSGGRRGERDGDQGRDGVPLADVARAPGAAADEPDPVDHVSVAAELSNDATFRWVHYFAKIFFPVLLFYFFPFLVSPLFLI